MKTKKLFMLALAFALVVASSAPTLATAKGAVVPFKGSYNGIPVAAFDPSCMCMRQTFEFDGLATHLGKSHFSATGEAYPGQTICQEGEGKFIAANGDFLYWSFKARKGRAGRFNRILG